MPETYVHKIPLLPADEADKRIQELEDDLADLRAENARLREKLMPSNFISAPEVLLWLDDFRDKLSTYVEKQCIGVTMSAIRRMQEHPYATSPFQPLMDTVEEMKRRWEGE